MRLLVLVLLIACAQALSAQEVKRLAPDQQAESPAQLAQLKTARFNLYRTELGKAFDAQQNSAVIYFQQKILEFLRAEAAFEATVPNTYQQKMREVLAAFEGFSFDPSQKEQAAPKFALLEEVFATLKKAE